MVQKYDKYYDIDLMQTETQENQMHSESHVFVKADQQVCTGLADFFIAVKRVVGLLKYIIL